MWGVRYTVRTACLPGKAFWRPLRCCYLTWQLLKGNTQGVTKSCYTLFNPKCYYIHSSRKPKVSLAWLWSQGSDPHGCWDICVTYHAVGLLQHHNNPPSLPPSPKTNTFWYPNSGDHPLETMHVESERGGSCSLTSLMNFSGMFSPNFSYLAQNSDSISNSQFSNSFIAC